MSCPECNSTKFYIDHETGERICSTCGLVIDQTAVIYRGPAVRAFSPEEYTEKQSHGDPQRQSNTKMAEGSIIHVMDIKVPGMSREDKIRFYRIRRQQIRALTKDSFDRNLVIAMGRLSTITSQLKTSNMLHEEAAKIYRQSLNRGLVKGRDINQIITACLYAAYRVHGVYIQLSTLEKVSKESEKDISRCYRLILKTLKLKVKLDRVNRFIPPAIEKLGLSQAVESRCVEILNVAHEKKSLNGRSPSGMASAILYVVCREKNLRVTQKMIADAVGVTEVTLRNRYKQLIEDLPELRESIPWLHDENPKETECVAPRKEYVSTCPICGEEITVKASARSRGAVFATMAMHIKNIHPEKWMGTLEETLDKAVPTIKMEASCVE